MINENINYTANFFAEEEPPIDNLSDNESALKIKVCSDPYDGKDPFSKSSDVANKDCLDEIIFRGIGCATMSISNKVEIVKNGEDADIVIRSEMQPSDDFGLARKEHAGTATFVTSLDDKNTIYFSPNYYKSSPTWRAGFQEGYMVKFAETLSENPEIIYSYKKADHDNTIRLLGLKSESGYHNFDYLDEFITPVLNLVGFDKEVFCAFYRCARTSISPIDGLCSVMLAASIYYLSMKER